MRGSTVTGSQRHHVPPRCGVCKKTGLNVRLHHEHMPIGNGVVVWGMASAEPVLVACIC